MTTEDAPYKRLWNEGTSKLLMEVFKEFYELWKNGSIEKKNQMWLKIAEDLNKKGLDCTASQAENRFKTLIRSYRKACGITPGKNGRRSIQQLSENFTDIFIENMGLIQGTSFDVDDEQDAIIINESNQDDTVQQFLDESTGSIFTLTPHVVALPRKRPIKTEVTIREMLNKTLKQPSEDENEDEDDDEEDEILPARKRARFLNRIDRIVDSNEQILKRNLNTNRKTVARKKQPVPVTAKTNVDVLLDLKELLKKIEIRRQARHEQNIKIAKERNEILKRKNELLENLLAKQDF